MYFKGQFQFSTWMWVTWVFCFLGLTLHFNVSHLSVLFSWFNVFILLMFFFSFFFSFYAFSLLIGLAWEKPLPPLLPHPADKSPQIWGVYISDYFLLQVPTYLFISVYPCVYVSVCVCLFVCLFCSVFRSLFHTVNVCACVCQLAFLLVCLSS